MQAPPLILVSMQKVYTRTTLLLCRFSCTDINRWILFIYLFIYSPVASPTHSPITKTNIENILNTTCINKHFQTNIFMRITRADDRDSCWQIRLQAELVLHSSCAQTCSKSRYNFTVWKDSFMVHLTTVNSSKFIVWRDNWKPEVGSQRSTREMSVAGQRLGKHLFPQ
jgi:hypothetical protein